MNMVKFDAYVAVVTFVVGIGSLMIVCCHHRRKMRLADERIPLINDL